MKKITYSLIALLFIAFQGCSSKTKTTFNKEQTLINVNNVINKHKHDKLHSALALSIDEKNNYLMGYSYDAASNESATNIAMKQCQNKSAGKVIKTPCQIYLLNNKTIRTLK